MTEFRAGVSLPEIALHLGDLYARAGLGLPPDDLHRALADYLGCHPEVHAATWALWATELELTGQDVGRAGAWLDFGFYAVVPME